MLYCPRCGNEVPDSERRCPSCFETVLADDRSAAVNSRVKPEDGTIFKRALGPAQDQRDVAAASLTMNLTDLSALLWGRFFESVLRRCVGEVPRLADPASFEVLYGASVRESERGSQIPFPEGASRFLWLDHLARNRQVVFHGATRSDLEVLKPLTEKETMPGRRKNLLYASSEPFTALARIWTKSVAARGCHHPFFLKCYRVQGRERVSYHPFMSVNRDLISEPELFRGTVYVCPRETFVCETSPRPRWYERMTHGRVSKWGSSWVSRQEVRPLFRITIGLDELPGTLRLHSGREHELKLLLWGHLHPGVSNRE